MSKSKDKSLTTEEKTQKVAVAMRDVVVMMLKIKFKEAYDRERWEAAAELARLIFDAEKMYDESDKEEQDA